MEEENERLCHAAAGLIAPTHSAEMHILSNCRYCSKGCQVLHWKLAQDSCKRKGRVDFALFNIPRIANRFLLTTSQSTEV
jgi:hypothetical protein